ACQKGIFEPGVRVRWTSIKQADVRRSLSLVPARGTPRRSRRGDPVAGTQPHSASKTRVNALMALDSRAGMSGGCAASHFNSDTIAGVARLHPAVRGGDLRAHAR